MRKGLLPSDYGKRRNYPFLSEVEFPPRNNHKQRSALKLNTDLDGSEHQPRKVESADNFTSLRSYTLLKRLKSDERRIYLPRRAVDAGNNEGVIKDAQEGVFCDHVVVGDRLPTVQRDRRRLISPSNRKTDTTDRRQTTLKKYIETRKDKYNNRTQQNDSNILGKGDAKSSSDTMPERPVVTTSKRYKKILKDVNGEYLLQPSLFPNVPPFLNFTNSTEKVKKLPPEIRNALQWKLSGTAPVLVAQVVKRSGFKIAEDDTSWASSWCKHGGCQLFKDLNDNQKVNHFPGTFHLGRKDRLWMNILKMQLLHGREHFSFVPQTFILPRHLKQLRSAWLEAGCRSRWIIKPPASARGIGVSVVHRWNDVPKTESVIVQKYVSRPYLINDTKFDLRLYILVTCFDPLRLYVFDDGLVRFASEKYSRSYKCLSEKYIHLTNYSVNRNNSCYVSNEDENVCQGHKWSLKCLWSYFRENGIDDRKVWSSLVDVVIKTVISCEEPINRMVKIYTKNRYSCYELFGFDIMLDYSLRPWLLEVNISPSLHSNSKLDTKVKSQLVTDVFNTVGFHIPVEINFTVQTTNSFKKPDVQKVSWNEDRFIVSREERQKQIKFERNGWSQSHILKNLSPDDVRQLILSEDELARCGNFVRVFPSEISSSYLRFFDSPRYYNLLLDAWERRHYHRRNPGIALLQSLCKKGIHLRISPSQVKAAESTDSKISDKTTQILRP